MSLTTNNNYTLLENPITFVQAGIALNEQRKGYFLDCGNMPTVTGLTPGKASGAWSYKSIFYHDGSVSGFEAGGLAQETNLIASSGFTSQLFSQTTNLVHSELTDVVGRYSVKLPSGATTYNSSAPFFMVDTSSGSLISPLDVSNTIVRVHVLNEALSTDNTLKHVCSPLDSTTDLPIITSYSQYTNSYNIHPQLISKYSTWTVQNQIKVIPFLKDQNRLRLLSSLPTDASNNEVVPGFPRDTNVEISTFQKVIDNGQTYLTPPDLKVHIVDETENQTSDISLTIQELDEFLRVPPLVGSNWRVGDLILYIASKYLQITYPTQVANRLSVNENICFQIGTTLNTILGNKQARNDLIMAFGRSNGSHYLNQDGLFHPSPVITEPSVEINFIIDVTIILRINMSQSRTIKITNLPFKMNFTNNAQTPYV